jgi:hypothetical protein
MNVYMKHPIHGTKIATLEMEVEFDEANGWVRYNPEDPEQIEEVAPGNELQKRRGRPPKALSQQGV